MIATAMGFGDRHVLANLVPIRWPEENHPGSQCRHQNHDAAKRIIRCDSVMRLARRTTTIPHTPITAIAPMTTRAMLTRTGKFTRAES